MIDTDFKFNFHDSFIFTNTVYLDNFVIAITLFFLLYPVIFNLHMLVRSSDIRNHHETIS